MRTLFSCLLISLLSFSLLIHDAEARRFGGGRSFGVQRSHQSLYTSNKVPKATAAKTQRTPQSNNRWAHLLGGVLIGGLLTSLFMGHGFANGILTWLLIAAALYFLVTLFRRKMQPGLQANASAPLSANRFTRFNQGASTGASGDFPLNFDNQIFLDHSKNCFQSLQKHFDEGNLEAMKSFVSPEILAEIQAQLNDNSQGNVTQILNLNAELLDVSRQANTFIASVLFTGSIQENGVLSSLNEIWHFRQFDNTSTWMVSGIQQEVFH